MQLLEGSEGKRGKKSGREKLEFYMDAKGMTQRDLATAVGWKSHSIVGRLLRGQLTTVDPEKAVRIAHVLEVSIDDLFVSRSSRTAQLPVAKNAAQGVAKRVQARSDRRVAA